MNRERLNKFIEAIKIVKWCHSDQVCDIGHTKRLNVTGAFLDTFLEASKGKWGDYLLPTVEQYDFKKKYDKYITTDQIDLNKLMSDAMAWYEMTSEEFDKIFYKDYEFISGGWQIERLVENM